MRILILVIFSSVCTLSAQTPALELKAHNGMTPIDILFNNKPEHIKLSSVSQPQTYCGGFPSTVPFSIAFRSHIFNGDSILHTGVQLEARIYNRLWQLKKTLYSEVADTLPAGDIALFQTDSVLTDDRFGAIINGFGVERHHIVFSINTDSATGPPLDTITFQHREEFAEGFLSTDFGNHGRPFGTNELGDDFSAFAVLLPFECSGYGYDNGFELFIAPETVAGGKILVEILDSAGYDEPASSPLAFESFTVDPCLNNTRIFGEFSSSFYDNLYEGEYYWFVFTLISYGGTKPIQIYNDTSVIQPKAVCLFYSTDSMKYMYDPEILSSPALTLHFRSDFTNPCATSTIDEINEEFSVLPNPTTGSTSYMHPLNKPRKVILYDSRGAVVFMEKEVYPDQKFSLHHLPSGVYQLTIAEEGTSIQASQLVIH